ncbi:hypothetical protein [Kordia zhangzhouensis]|uniref:hypothetical protein n=1 Tax=Kordia zhangzhouensis TaxID=1620405 RepID=UPI0006296EC4|nr:hypothetical protein [Kordia zhangzhouensis]
MGKLSISGTVSFKKDCQDRWQTVYTSSLYGTMFSIFGKFTYNEVDGKLSIKLKLINYKGIINLGIHSADFQKLRRRIEVYDNSIDKKIIRVISLKVNLKGVHENKTYDLEIDPTLSEDDFKKDIYLEIDRELLPLENDICNELKDDIFDTEFYYRDGERPNYVFESDYLNYRQGRFLNLALDDNNNYINSDGHLIDLRGRRVDSQRRLIDEFEELIPDCKGNPKYGDFKSRKRSPGAVCPKGYSKIIF